MKRKILVYLLCVVMVFGIASSFIFQNHPGEKKLAKISLADTTLTSRIYMT